MSNHKTPVSLLQEVCAKRALTPMYELLSNQGVTHEPIYVYKCSAGEWSAQSKGPSKKKAKHYVALLVLIKMVTSICDKANEVSNQLLEEVKLSASGLLGRDDAFSIISSEYVFCDANIDNIFDAFETGNAMMCPLNEEEIGNPIGTLQELCQKNMWPQANYDFTMYHSKHDTQCTLTLWRWSVAAEGKSRKLAKRKASIKMLEKISIENLSIPRDMLDMLEEGTLKLHDENNSAVENGKETSMVTEIQRAYGRNLRGLYNSKGQPIVTSAVALTTLSTKVDELDEVCNQHKLAPLYTYVCKTRSGCVYCLLQLNTVPVHVVRGRGDCLEEARESAARECLEFLCNMIHPAMTV